MAVSENLPAKQSARFFSSKKFLSFYLTFPCFNSSPDSALEQKNVFSKTNQLDI
jgi:hypothetical protein